MKKFGATILLCSCVLFGAAPANATTITYQASLSGSAESTPNASPGTGIAIVIVDNVANTMEVKVTFADLLGATAAAHIHCCTASAGTGTAGVATTLPTFSGFPLGVTSGTYDNTLDMTAADSYNPAFITANGGTLASAEAAIFAGLAAGEAYLNIHTNLFIGGEIRGFLTATPIPTALPLLASGLGTLGLFGWRRKRKNAAARAGA
jgi:CHRD domain